MSLVNELIKGLLPENEQREVAVYGGGFKPPTKGHFDVIKKALDKNPNIDKFIVLIGGKERDGISPDESLLIWGIYKKYLPISVEIQLSSKPPIQAVYNYAKNNPEELVLFVIGAREGNEEDFKDIASRTTSLDKYPNMRLETVITKGGVSGTAARNAAKISLEKFKPFVPSELSDEEVEEVYNIVSNKVQEILTENASYSENINLKREIAKLTKHMIDKGMNIQPLPKLVFKNGDSENAKQFLGKTAYYDPNSQSIVLYTEGRHPKDIVRSFSHEMVHHTQFLEDRLGDVSTTNTMEDDNINKLEQEANLKGTMTFRNWTDSLQEKKNKDPFGLNAYAMELGRLREEEIDVSGLDKLDDEIKKALEDASKEETPTNEIIGLTTVALIVAIPGIINAITKVIKALAQKSGIQLKKEDPKWYEVLEKATGKIDDYLDTPFNFMLKPFVKDSIKRAKYAKILKAVTLTLMSISALADPSKIKDTTSLIKSLAPDIGGELIQAIGEKNSSNIGKMLKVAFNNIK
jgi:hypothetical protein